MIEREKRTYLVVKPKLRGYALIAVVLFIIGVLSTIYLYLNNLDVYIVLDAIILLGIAIVSFRVLALSLYTYKITDAYVEKSRRFITDDVHKMPIRRIQSYEIKANVLDKLAGTSTIILKHGAYERPTMSLYCVGNEYIDSIENVIELIIRRDVKGPYDYEQERQNERPGIGLFRFP
ncbi:MAG: PH domain-containing protein [Candidatus Micrarchaeia archaeon]